MASVLYKEEFTKWNHSKHSLKCLTWLKVVGPAAKFGINKVPAFLYFEDNIPTVYDEDPSDHKAIVEWIEEQRTSDAIEVDRNL